MPYVLGIDIGTTSTVAASARPDGDPSPQLLWLGTRGPAVPSVVYLDEAGQALVGEAAERRTVSHPERVVREVKRRVGDTVPVSVGDIAVTPEDLYAAQARWVLDRAEEQEGEPPDAVAVAVPATWGSYRAGIVRDALADAGLPDVTLVSEPRAAARHYLAQPRVADGATVAVYDFGGGTFDAAVVRRSGPDGCEIIGRPEGLERLGGADLDELVLAHVAAAVGDALTDLSPQAPGALAALARLRRECTEAKEALSADAETTVPVLLPGLQTQVRIVRAELEELIAPAVEQTLDVLATALHSAEVAPEDLEAILLVGGSSRIPLVAELLSARFGRPVAVDTDPQASVALGAARAAAESLAVATAGSAAPALAAVGAFPRGWTVAAGSISEPTAFEDAVPGTTAETPDEAPARLVAAGGSFVPRQDPARRRHVTGVRVLAVSAAVLGITVVTSMAGQTPAVIEAGRSTLSSVVAKLGDSVQPDTPAAAAAEVDARAGGAGAPMATDASVFAGRRAHAQAIATTTPQETRPARSTDGAKSSDPRTPAVVEGPGKGSPAPSPRPSGTTGGGTGTKAPSSPSPTSPGTATPGTGTPSTPVPTTNPTTPPPTQVPTTPPPTTPPVTPEPTEPPTTNPTTPPTTQEPTEPPTTDPTTPPTTQEPTTPAATPTAAPSEASFPTTDPAPPSPSAGGG
ncbi:Hsp70 protein [Georgenia soli]|uniref:Hsp70 protein n=1 Tax=Georgenia soli TaxID=638953 RepID=A0A2A9EIL8_9MICO|nr:Hsp70 family protein [Georgenia soli]PFG38738.1 Hsp70 protein [Georgenia soli]